MEMYDNISLKSSQYWKYFNQQS